MKKNQLKLKKLIRESLKINEAPEYEDFFDSRTLSSLDRERQTQFAERPTGDIMGSLYKIQSLEAPHKEELEKLAVKLVKEFYPIVDKIGITIDAKIGRPELTSTPSYSNPVKKDELKDEAAKRRIINAITQGMGVNTHGMEHMAKEKLDKISPELLDYYKKLSYSNEYIYQFNPEMIARAAVSQAKSGGGGGSSKVTGKHIKARAIIFQTLIHEIVKGIYEIISKFGFQKGANKEDVAEILGDTDNIYNEIQDIRQGKFIAKKLRDWFLNTEFEIILLDKRKLFKKTGSDLLDDFPYFFEEFLKYLYRLNTQEFIPIIKGIIRDNVDDYMEIINKKISIIYKDLEKK